MLERLNAALPTNQRHSFQKPQKLVSSGYPQGKAVPREVLHGRGGGGEGGHGDNRFVVSPPEAIRPQSASHIAGAVSAVTEPAPGTWKFDKLMSCSNAPAEVTVGVMSRCKTCWSNVE